MEKEKHTHSHFQKLRKWICECLWRVRGSHQGSEVEERWRRSGGEQSWVGERQRWERLPVRSWWVTEGWNGVRRDWNHDL